ncbi:MAG: CBS domain-containing protein [Pseudomonadota bacterium]
MQIKDRPEFSNKPRPLTAKSSDMAASAVAAMVKRNYGSTVVVDDESKVIGILTERDIMIRLVNDKRDPATTPISEIMTANPRVAKETDNVLDWLRIMSNDRFRRVPIVDDNDNLISVMTQGDFVSYTWPDLAYQAKQLAKATLSSNYQIVIILAGIAVYSLLLTLALS